jgi:dienelactone hydrolase
MTGTAFERWDVGERSVGSVRYYLAPASAGPRPLLVVVQGSGCGPLFSPDQDNGGHAMRATAGQDIVQQLGADGFVVMVVEKPGVASESPEPDDLGTAGGCSDEFRRAHSLPSWTRRLSLAVDAAKRDPRVASDAPVRLLGLSEGAIAVARLASERSDVSHVAFISGFGCDQWRDVLVVARRQAEAAGADPVEAVAEAEAGLRRVAADPSNTEAVFDGQTHLYWSTFGRACPADDLARSGADVFVAYGTADEQVDAEGVEAIPAARIAAGKSVTVRRVIGGTHVLNTPSTRPFENLVGVLKDVVGWMRVEDTTLSE